MASITIQVSEAKVPDLADLVEHSLAVDAGDAVSAVYDFFQKNSHEFVAVMKQGRAIGLVSRGRVGFILGARFGLAVYGRQPIGQHMLCQHLCIKQGTSMLEVFEAALSRTGEFFYDDVLLVDAAGNYLGMIPMQSLVRLQTQMIAEQMRLAQTQRTELEDKNRQLFRSVNELRQSRGRYEILFENSALGVMLLDRHGVIETCNDRAEHMLGIGFEPEGPARRVCLAEMISPADWDKFTALLDHMESAALSSAANSAELTLSLPGRGPRLFKFFMNMIQETGQICALLDDVTEQRVLERRMQQKEKSALLESLVGGIAHEINNKLSPIVGYIELLAGDLQQLPQNADLENYCRIIRDSALESAKIIRQLLQLSRPHRIETARCDLKLITEDAINLLRFRLRILDCQINLQLPDADCLLMADATQLKQVIINLVLNAADAMEGGSVRSLTVRLQRLDRHFHLYVSDTGHGISIEHLGRIFDPFFTTKGPDRGTGLGLSVCYSVVKQHAGEISVESAVGAGSTFKVILPVGELTAHLGPSALPVRVESSPALLPSRVLVVDDEEFVAGLIQETLRMKLGCKIDKAMNGNEAIERLCKVDYDLVISDVRMPVMDGLALLDWIKVHKPVLVSRFVFITGDAGSQDLNEKLEQSEITVLRKPFDIETLLHACRQRMQLKPYSRAIPQLQTTIAA